MSLTRLISANGFDTRSEIQCKNYLCGSVPIMWVIMANYLFSVDVSFGGVTGMSIIEGRGDVD